MSFQGFPEAALDFYDDLEQDNSKAFWEAHKETYRRAVADPMNQLVEALGDEFGQPKVFRPYRDVRFAKDKTPYKTHQGAFFAVGPATGYYVQIGAPGVKVAVGYYDAAPERLANLRAAVDHDLHGPALEELIDALDVDGWEIGGSVLRTAPRGWDKDHPRIALLRHKTLTASRDYGFEDFIHSPALVDRIRADWRSGTPLVEWALRHG
ncbi:DUF2461 domain-containing protein [Williamsia soli]|uniref:DUF2461 domain-containing protein n=1 Tax=Williamsia soli TaxID=364929 RepID=UPI001A9E771E|nr:DUF2461 domain-containing protein [Williamsia soli]